MRALKLIQPMNLQMVELPQPGNDDGKKAVIQVKYAGICASDLGLWYRGDCLIAPGHEFCGTIVDPGNAKDLKVGDRVSAIEITPCFECEACKDGYPNLCSQAMAAAPGITVDGAMAEYVAVRTDMVRKLPKEVSDVEAAMIEPAAVAHRALSLAGLKKGDKVLITGCGPIGIMAAAIAKALGASLAVMTELNSQRMNIPAEKPYVDRVFNAAEHDLDNKLRAVSGTGFDVAIEATGSSQATATAIKALKVGGKLGVVGVHDVTLGVPIVDALFRSVKITGDLYFLPQDFDAVIELMRTKKLKIEDLATSIHGISEGQQLFQNHAAGQSVDVKILLDPLR